MSTSQATGVPSVDDPIRAAFRALAQEQHVLSIDIERLQKRLNDVKAALVTIRPLIASEDPSDSAPAQDTLPLTGAIGPYSGMKFSQAFRQFMRSLPEAMSVPDITTRFADSGWKFSSDERATQLNQVGVALRRGEGKHFAREENNRWIYREGQTDGHPATDQHKADGENDDDL